MSYLQLLFSVFFLFHPSVALAAPLSATPPAVLEAIAIAESGGRQFDQYGNILCDHVTHTHCGIYQVGLEHYDQALSMGWSLYTPEGNTAYAIWLYEREGTGPWMASYLDKTNPNSWGHRFHKDGTPRLTAVNAP